MLIPCPECNNNTSDKAHACPACGYPNPKQFTTEQVTIKQVTTKRVPTKNYNCGIAALLSLIIPGAGQIYKGQIVTGLILLVLVTVGYCLIIPGMVLHLCCILEAAGG